MFHFAARVDQVAKVLTGMSGSIPFGIANVVSNHGINLVKASPAAQGVLAGLATFLLTHFGGRINSAATEHTPWMKPAAGQLDPVIRDALAAAQPTPMQRVWESGTAYQAFPATFVLATGLSYLAGFAGEGAAQVANSVTGPLASVVAGGVAAAVQKEYDTRNRRDGPVLLLASSNWANLLQELEDATVKSSIDNGFRQVSQGFGSKAKSGIEAAVGQLATPSSVAKAALPFAAGFAINRQLSEVVDESLMNKEVEHLGLSKVAIETIKGLATDIGLSPITFVWTTINALSSEIDESTRTKSKEIIEICAAIVQSIKDKVLRSGATDGDINLERGVS
ncbi:hypothetical protein KDW41_24765 [Burkholderia vietnamiensis]|nr:hypothetical protein [Burkholderia vietnamiensis]